MIELLTPRRVPLADFRLPCYCAAGNPGERYSRRSKKLTEQDIDTIQRTNGRTLRDLATEYGVSHETIRATRLGAIPDDRGDNVQGGFTPAWITPCLKR